MQPEASQLLPYVPETGARAASVCSPTSEDLAHHSAAPEQSQQWLRYHGGSFHAHPAPPDIEFVDVHLRYNQQGQAALTAVNLHLSSGLKHGICGRTGEAQSDDAMWSNVMSASEPLREQVLLLFRQKPLPVETHCCCLMLRCRQEQLDSSASATHRNISRPDFDGGQGHPADSPASLAADVWSCAADALSVSGKQLSACSAVKSAAPWMQ